MKTQIILSITKNNTIVIANVENNNHFSISFDEVEPFIITDDIIDDRLEELTEEYASYENININKARKIINNEYDNYGIESLFDISLYSESFLVDDDEIYFLSISCGQIDCRNDIIKHENKELTEKIFQLWDKYHLQEINNIEITDLFYDIQKENNRKDFDDLMESLGKEILKIKKG